MPFVNLNKMEWINAGYLIGQPFVGANELDIEKCNYYFVPNTITDTITPFNSPLLCAGGVIDNWNEKPVSQIGILVDFVALTLVQTSLGKKGMQLLFIQLGSLAMVINQSWRTTFWQSVLAYHMLCKDRQDHRVHNDCI